MISQVLSMDVQVDKISYGRLSLKPRFGVDFCLFDGLQGLGKFMRVHGATNFSDEVCYFFKHPVLVMLVCCYTSNCTFLCGYSVAFTW